MQIVIKIPEEIYSRILERNRIHTFDNETVCDAIKNGTPLPKGHGRLIDGDRLQAQLFNKTLDAHFMPINKISCDDISECFDNTPTIIEADTEREGY